MPDSSKSKGRTRSDSLALLAGVERKARNPTPENTAHATETASEGKSTIGHKSTPILKLNAKSYLPFTNMSSWVE